MRNSSLIHVSSQSSALIGIMYLSSPIEALQTPDNPMGKSPMVESNLEIVSHISQYLVIKVIKLWSLALYTT